jgi:hypothetical protein
MLSPDAPLVLFNGSGYGLLKPILEEVLMPGEDLVIAVPSQEVPARRHLVGHVQEIERPLQLSRASGLLQKVSAVGVGSDDAG